MLTDKKAARKTEVIKVEIPAWLAEKFRKHVAEKYGLRRGAISEAITDIIKRELGLAGPSELGGVDSLVGLGLLSGYEWRGEDLVEALRRRSQSVPDRR